MSDTDKILHALAEMQKDIKSLQEGQTELRADVKSMQGEVKSIRDEQKNLDLKVEAFHAEQTKSDTQILTILTDMNEINAKSIDTRVTRIERHLNLPPLK